MEIPKKVYLLFFGGIAVGVVTSLVMIALLFPFSREEDKSRTETAVRPPVFGEKEYNPEISGYPALIGIVKSAGTDEIIFDSSLCLKEECDSAKTYEYHAKIARDTLLKRLIKKSEAALTAETAIRKDKNTPPNPFDEQPFRLDAMKAGENVTVLIKEIINDTTIIAHEIRIFEPLSITP